MNPHVHNYSGPTMTCECGYRFTVAKYNLQVEVGEARIGVVPIVDECFNTDSLRLIARTLRAAADRVDRAIESGPHGGA